MESYDDFGAIQPENDYNSDEEPCPRLQYQHFESSSMEFASTSDENNSRLSKDSPDESLEELVASENEWKQDSIQKLLQSLDSRSPKNINLTENALSTPTNKDASEAVRVEDKLTNWNKRKEEKLLKKQNELRLADQKLITLRPNLCARSIEMTRNRGNVRVEDRLLKNAEIAETRRKEYRNRIIFQEVPGKPVITEYSSQLDRQGNTSHRLHSDASEYSEKRRIALEQKLRREREQCFQATALRQSLRLYRTNGRSIGDDLYQRGMEQGRKKDLLRKLRDSKETYTPRTNKRSAKIASGLQTTSKERLLSGVKSIKSPRSCGKNKQSPSGGKKKGKPSSGKSASKGRWEELYAHGSKKMLDIARLQKEEAEKELKECTFKPDIRKKSVKHSGSHTPSRKSTPKPKSKPTKKNQAMVTRLYNWKKSIDTKKQQKRDIKESRKLEGCTFRPNISKPKMHQNMNSAHAYMLSDDGERGFTDTDNTSRDTKHSEQRSSTAASLNSLEVHRYCRDPRQILRYPMSRCRNVFYPSTEKEKLALAIIIKRSATEREARRVKRRQQEELAKLKARGHPNLTEEMCW